MEMSPSPDQFDSIYVSVPSESRAQEASDSYGHSDAMDNEMPEEETAEEGGPQYMEVEDEPKDASTAAAPAASGDGIAPQSAQLVPCLKGMMSYVGGVVYCKGRWAMSQQAHDNAGQTSEFEFKLVKADENGNYFPVSGLYQGWFNVKQPPPAKGNLKVEDKEMKISYSLAENGCHTVVGEGHNKYGRFRLSGTLHEDGSVVMFREYFQLNPSTTAAAPTPKRGKPVATEKKERPAVKKEEIFSPRESVGRVRKQSFFLTDFHDPMQRSKSSETLEKAPSSSAPPATTSAQPRTIAAAAASAAAALAKQTAAAAAPETTSRMSLSRSASERAPRLSAAMKRCADLLKELSKHPQALWFLEPVDPIALKIPDYPKIIKNPMDFSTVRNNIETGVYENINAFAEHVRLVFRNAIQFNSQPDNVVNIAARELSSRFEEKFRSLQRQVDPDEYIPEAKPLQRSMSMGSTVGKRSRSLKEVAASNKPKNVGPRSAPYLPPAAMDGSAQTILELQRMMASMQDEIKQLRATVKEKEVMQKVQETREAALNPLSFEEKRLLVTQIHKLPPRQMEQVLEMIQRALPAGAYGEGEVEVPLDALDTLTLRKLQTFIDNYNDSKAQQQQKKRPFSSTPNLARAASAAAANAAPKKVKRARPSNSSSAAGDLAGSADGSDLAFFDEDDLLFATDTFEDGGRMAESSAAAAAVHAAAAHSSNSYSLESFEGTDAGQSDDHQSSFKPQVTNMDAWAEPSEQPRPMEYSRAHDNEDDEDNMWSVAAAELRAKRPDIDSYG